ncbi:hypothetical protein C1J03_04275 [Sulfitobacter sp. SK012]|uniref:DUF2927 domain-containing protein n=1 Tax=Sulfitobacter sp. SK012 TaxID=1389005 RepID=UPI000E0A4C17|nr:DUF2927 domain-containing protein [Sulfitobacter sp. SK012]AXI45323.1 hypothetical protein C1J03_04275 [Sulfitobacter sp. SK012]
MRKSMLALSAALTLGLGLSLGGARAADEISDATMILNAKSNTIKKWHYSPRFVVVHDRPVDREAFADVAEFIRDTTGLAMDPPDFVHLASDTLADRFYTESHYAPRRTDAGRMTSDLLIAGHEDLNLTANVFVFMVSPPLASHLMLLTAWGRSSSNLPRAYAQGSGPCYFNVLSNADSIHFGTIVISPDIAPTMQASCIYEEMTQAMGLMNDAQNSPFFTYDNLDEDKPRTYDRRLLAALYNADVTNGDAVEKVLGIYAKQH